MGASDALIALRAGYAVATLASIDYTKLPLNYHWPSDVSENVDFGTLGDAVRLSEGLIRRLDESWI